MPKQDRAVAMLLQALDLAFDKQSWHGANLTGALRGVSAAEALRRVRGRKCVWEQLLHAAYWKYRALSKLSGGVDPFPRKGSNWPAPPTKPTDAQWRADLLMLRDIHRRLREHVAGLGAADLDRPTTWLIHGAAAHDLYHSGQIKLLRRLLG